MREISLQGHTWKGMTVVQICVLYEFIYCTCTVDSTALISIQLQNMSRECTGVMSYYCRCTLQCMCLHSLHDAFCADPQTYAQGKALQMS